MLPRHEATLLIIIATALLLIIGAFLVLFVLYFLKKKRQVFFEKELLKKNFDQALLESQLEIQEQTLQHISRELHDNLGHQASLIKIHLHTLNLADPNAAIAQVAETKDVTRQLIADIKALSVSLGSERITNAGLRKGIEAEVERLNKTGQFQAHFTAEGDTHRLGENVAIILYRMVQEILNNAIKHSEAKNIWVALKVGDDAIRLDLRDDGKGFDIAEREKSGGAGLGNLKNRAKMLRANLEVISQPGRGTGFTIVVPQ